MRTIKGNYRCMTTIGHRIAVACYGYTVTVYDSDTGVQRLSLLPGHLTEAIQGSPDGSVLFCVHQEGHLITSWDIQTGGLIHTFTLEWEAKYVAVSLRGHYLACGFSNGFVNFWEVANKMEGPAFESGSPVTHLCWLAPEEHLMVASETVVRIHDVVTGRVLHRFDMPHPVSGVAYSQESNQLAITTGVKATITIIDPQTGASLASYDTKRWLSCFAFSQTTKQLVCGTNLGLLLFDLPTWRQRGFDHPTTLKSISTLSNGTVVAIAQTSGLQFLSLGEEYAVPTRLGPRTSAVYSLDEGRIIAVIPTLCDRVTLLELATMHQLVTILGRGLFSIRLPDPTVVLCASLENLVGIHCFKEGDKENLQLWRFGDQSPGWTVKIDQPASIGRISPTGARLVTFHIVGCQTICIWDTGDGALLAKLLLEHPSPQSPLDITFDSEDRFYSHHDTYRILHVFVTSSEPGPTHSVTRSARLPPVPRPWKKHFSVVGDREWVVSGSQRICWLPPGYITFQTGYCWVGSTLVMAGEDDVLRKITFRE